MGLILDPTLKGSYGNWMSRPMEHLKTRPGTQNTQQMSAIITKPHVVSPASKTVFCSKPCVWVPDHSPDGGVPTCAFQVGWSQAGVLNSQPKFKGHFQVCNISIWMENPSFSISDNNVDGGVLLSFPCSLEILNKCQKEFTESTNI